MDWPERKIIRHLWAASGQKDVDLVRLGLHPNRMRDRYFQTFWRSRKIVDFPLGEQNENQKDGGVLFDLDIVTPGFGLSETFNISSYLTYGGTKM